MGWLNTLLDVGILAGQWSSMSKLEALKQQGAESAMIQAVLRDLRNQIFNYKQSAEEIVAAESQNPKRSAGAMKLLELQLKESGIVPDLFLDLGDKEYVAATTRFIRDNSNRMLAGLPAGQQGEVTSFAVAASRLPDYDYYLAHFDDGYRYRTALPEAQKYKVVFDNSMYVFLQRISQLVVFGLMGMLLGFAIGQSTVGLIIGLGGWFIFTRSNSAGQQRRTEAKKTVDTLKGKIDLDRFNALDSEFNGNRERVTNLQQQARALVAAFFGNGAGAALPISAPASPTSLTGGVTGLLANSSVQAAPVQGPLNLSKPSATGTMICRTCGGQNPPGAKFCMKCGQSLGQSGD